MPAKLRDELGERFTVTKGLDGCLAVYPEKEWEALEQRIRGLGNGEKARRVKRYYFANAFDAQLDAQGRILIPANLREFADLQKDVVVIGQLDHAEIWDSEKWRIYNEAIDAESVAADVEDMDF
ncbi:MAG TPA: division/cell wall cluster transcriptional repressor MraZ [Candidatus Agathobaculum merdavium]|nr:division/cell wall cluster transcriptional repressor MraZ [Candidatus Agathobaculum merdavium]